MMPFIKSNISFLNDIKLTNTIVRTFQKKIKIKIYFTLK